MEKEGSESADRPEKAPTAIYIESHRSANALISPLPPPQIDAALVGRTRTLLEPVWMQRLQSTWKPDGIVGTVLSKLQLAPAGLVPLMERTTQIANQIGNSIARFEGPWRKIVEDIGAIAKQFEAYPDEMRAGLLAMSRSGWYLDLEMGTGEPIRFKQAVDVGREVDAEREMIDHFDRRADGIRTELIQKYPHRRRIFEAAFDAHANGQYVLSIPVLLAQVDGICFDVAKAHFFMGRERAKVVEHAVELAGSEIAKAFLAPFQTEMSVTFSEKSRPEGFAGLNRHTVLHGESVDYGTRENGLRAISLLNYMSQSLQHEIDKPDEDTCDSSGNDAQNARS